MFECTKCGNTQFNAHQVSHHDITVYGNNDFVEDKGIYEANTPFGPYTCTKCGTVFEEIPGE